MLLVSLVAPQCRRPQFNSWVAKIPRRRAWQPIPVFLPGESPWTEEPGRLQSMESQRIRYDWATKQSTTQHVLQASFSREHTWDWRLCSKFYQWRVLLLEPWDDYNKSIAIYPSERKQAIAWYLPTYKMMANNILCSAGVRLQQPGNQPEEMDGVGEKNEAASQFSWTAYLFQV